MNLCDSDDDWICNRAGAWDWMSHFFPSPAPIGSNVPGLLLSSYDNVKSPVFSMESLPSVLSVFSMEPLPSALSFSVMTFDGDDFIFVNCFLTFLMRLGFESSLGTLSCCQQKTFYWKPGQVKMDLKKMENHKRVNVEHWLRLGTEMELDGARASPRRRASRPRSRNPPASMSFFPAIALLWCLRTPHPWRVNHANWIWYNRLQWMIKSKVNHPRIKSASTLNHWQPDPDPSRTAPQRP